MSEQPKVRFGVGVSVDVTSREFTEQEMALRRKAERERDILVGFVMSQAKVSQEDAEHLVGSGMWDSAMKGLRIRTHERRVQMETPVMLTEGTDG